MTTKEGAEGLEDIVVETFLRESHIRERLGLDRVIIGSSRTRKDFAAELVRQMDRIIRSYALEWVAPDSVPQRLDLRYVEDLLLDPKKSALLKQHLRETLPAHFQNIGLRSSYLKDTGFLLLSTAMSDMTAGQLEHVLSVRRAKPDIRTRLTDSDVFFGYTLTGGNPDNYNLINDLAGRIDRKKNPLMTLKDSGEFDADSSIPFAAVVDMILDSSPSGAAEFNRLVRDAHDAKEYLESQRAEGTGHSGLSLGEYTGLLKEFSAKTDLRTRFGLDRYTIENENEQRKRYGKIKERTFTEEIEMYLSITEGRARTSSVVTEYAETQFRKRLRRVLMEDDHAVSMVSEHLARTTPKKIKVVSKKYSRAPSLIDVKRDVGLLLHALGYIADDKDTLAEMIRRREAQDVFQRAAVIEPFLFYALDGGDPQKITAIDDIVAGEVSNSRDLLSLRDRELYKKAGYSGFSRVIDLMIGFAPKDRQQFIYIKETIESAKDQVLKSGHKRPEWLTAESLVEQVQAICWQSFGGDVSVAPRLAEYLIKSYKDSNFAKATGEETASMLEGLFASMDPAQAASAFNLFMEIKKRYPDERISNHLSRFAADAKDPEMLGHFRRACEKVHDINTLNPVDNRLDYWKTINAIEREHSRLDSEEIGRREKFREALIKDLGKEFSVPLIAASYSGEMHAVSLDTLSELIKYLSNNQLMKTYRNGTVSDTRRFSKNVMEELHCMTRFGEQEMLSLEKAMQSNGLKKPAKGSIKTVDRDTPANTYRALREVVFGSLCEGSEEFRLLTESQPESGGSALYGLISHLNKDMTLLVPEMKELIESYFRRSAQVIAGLKGQDERTVKTSFRNWHDNVVSKKTLDELRGAIQFGSITELVTSVDGGKNRRPCVVEEVGPALGKFASFFGRSPYSVYRTEALDSSIVLPKPAPRRIMLPEIVNCLDTHEANRRVYSFMTSLQSSFGRYGFFPEDSERLVHMFDSFGNPGFARSLWNTINYERAKRLISSTRRGLDRDIRSTITDIQTLYKESLLEALPDPEGVLRSLEQVLVLEIEPQNDVMGFVREMVVPMLDSLGQASNEEVMQLVRDVYQVIDEKIPVPKPQEQVADLSEGIRYTGMQLPETTGADYRNQPVFFFDECGGVRKVRLIVKDQSAVTNDRVAKAREEHSQRIKRLHSLLEMLRPDRVVNERHVYEGELDEDAYFDMLLELKAGLSPDTNVFRNRRIIERDISVLLSMGQSQSLGGWLKD
ncbi:TPA: hypothetical protein HA265_06775, partial [Candidatus Woesearchaeota archaeon]|nr:hypothetical protein [Candidatus Woesearchaeota archaeon]